MGNTEALTKMGRMNELGQRRNILKDYLYSCITEGDWHGVSDAANDLREVDAEMRGLEK